MSAATRQSDTPLPRAELAAWLRLTTTSGVGLAAARKLLASLGSPEAIFAAGPPAWRQIVGPTLSAALADAPPGLDALTDTTQQWLADAPSRRLLTLGDADYPAALLHTADPPLLLHAHGRIELLSRAAIAVVGSRNPTAQGLDHARAFAAAFSEVGLTVVSGLALGIDGAAHAGALQHADTGGSTIAVLGTGLDRVYPRRHLALAHQIAREGLLLSEYTLGTPPLPANFPRRNRIISGLSLGTLVVEAALKSGSLVTARLAAEQGREVFAIPGSIHAPQSRGCHELIRQGARLVESVTDVLDELPWQPDARQPSSVARQQLAAHEGEPSPAGHGDDPVLTAMGYDPVSLDALLARTGWPAAELSAHLLSLELEGRVVRLPGSLFQRRAAA